MTVISKLAKVPFGMPLLPINAPDNAWGFAIAVLSGNLAEKRHQGEFTGMTCDYVWLCLGEVIRMRWDSKFTLGIPPRIRREIKPAADVLGCLLELCAEVWFAVASDDYPHPCLLFVDVLGEMESWGSVATLSGSTTKTRFCTMLQAQNSALARMENPFEQPVTSRLFDVVIEKAERSDKIASQYKELLAARKAFVTSIRTGQDEFVLVSRSQNGKALRSKARGKNVKNTTPETVTGKGFQKLKCSCNNAQKAD